MTVKKPACTAFAALLLLGAVSAGAHAADDTRLYIGGAVGRSTYNLPKNNGTTPSLFPVFGKNSKSGTAFKVYGGYRFTENFGVEVGYARLGSFSRAGNGWYGGLPRQEKGTGNVFYGAATARLPLSDAFAINGRLGFARGRVNGGDNAYGYSNTLFAHDQRIGGRATGLMFGVGLEYALTRNIALTADYDHFGKLSKQVKGGMFTVGVRANF